jgi:hypothetical protein
MNASGVIVKFAGHSSATCDEPLWMAQGGWQSGESPEAAQR